MNFLKFFFPHFSENFTRADLVLESGFLSYHHHASCTPFCKVTKKTYDVKKLTQLHGIDATHLTKVGADINPIQKALRARLEIGVTCNPTGCPMLP